MDLSQYTEKNNENFLLVSNIPEVCKSEPCVLGIDEAGRGPVLGPMVYGIAFCPKSKNADLKNLGVDDSKALTEEQREKLLNKVLDNNEYIGWAIHLLSPSYISTSMNRRPLMRWAARRACSVRACGRAGPGGRASRWMGGAGRAPRR